MPERPPRPPRPLSRRCVLAAGLALAVTACTAPAQPPAASPTGRAAGQPVLPARMIPEPDAQAATRAIAASTALLDRYAATVRRHPALSASLSPLAGEHEAHLVALRQQPPAPAPGAPAGPAAGSAAAPPAAPSPASSAGSSGESDVAPIAVPAERSAALRALAAAELEAADAGSADLLAASPALARLLASIAAAQAVHADLLEPTARPSGAWSDPGTSGVDALQHALGGEHAAIFGYGVAGAVLPAKQREQATAAYGAHLARRDRLAALVREAGASPVVAQPAYALPFPVRTPAQARELARRLEEALAATYAEMVAVTEGQLRGLATAALRESAVWAARWRGGSVPFPGLPG